MNAEGVPNSDPNAVSLRTLAKRTGIDAKKLVKIMRKAGITKALDGGPLYGTRGLIGIAEATAAIEKWKPGASTAASTPSPLAALRTEAAEAKTKIPEPAPVKPTGDLETDPIDRSQVALVGDLSSGGFPNVPSVPVGWKHFWWNADPRRMEKKRLQGWRAVTDPKKISEIDPSGRLLSLRTEDGRVHWGDTILCLIPADLWSDQKKAQRANRLDIEAAVNDHRANIEAMNKGVRDKHGRLDQEPVTMIEASGEEIDAREEHARNRRRASQSGAGA